MRILFIGDIVAKGGRTAVAKALPEVKKEFAVDLVFANAENLSHGRGFSVETIKDMQLAGVDYFTGGDHLFWQKNSFDEIENLPIIRPANYSEILPGQGYAVIDTPKTGRVLLINLIVVKYKNIPNPINPKNNCITKKGIIKSPRISMLNRYFLYFEMHCNPPIFHLLLCLYHDLTLSGTFVVAFASRHIFLL